MLVTHWSKNVLLRNLPDESKRAARTTNQIGNRKDKIRESVVYTVMPNISQWK